MRQIFLSIVLLLLMVSTGGCILQDVMNSKAATTLGAVNVVDPNPTSDKVSVTLVNQTEILLGVSVLNADAPKDKGIKPGETVVVTIPKNTKPQIEYLTPKFTDKNDLNVLAADGSTNKYIISFAKKNHLIIRNNSGLDLNIQPKESVDIKNRWNKISILKGEMGVISSDVEITKELLDIDLWDRVDLTYENGIWIAKSKNSTNVNIEKIDILEYPNKIDANIPVTIKAIITPSDAQNQDVMWSVDDSSVATIEYSGLTALVTGKKAGAVSITVQSVSDYLVQKTIKIQVMGGSSEVKVESIVLKATSTTININGTTEITADIFPSGATNKNITWSSSNTEVADFINMGSNIIKVTGYSEGNTKITATTENGKTAEITVVVKNDTIPVTGITLQPSNSNISLDVDGTPHVVRVLLEPSNVTDRGYTAKSSDSTIVRLSVVNAQLTISPLKVGSCVITITADSNPNIMQTLYVDVKDNGTTIGDNSGIVTFTGNYMLPMDQMVFTYNKKGKLVEITKMMYNYDKTVDNYKLSIFYGGDGSSVTGAKFSGIENGFNLGVMNYQFSGDLLMNIKNANNDLIATYNYMGNALISRDTYLLSGKITREYLYDTDGLFYGYTEGYNSRTYSSNSSSIVGFYNQEKSITYFLDSDGKCDKVDVYDGFSTYTYTKQLTAGKDNFNVISDLIYLDALMMLY